MSIFQRIVKVFRRPRVMAFVDYEYWYYSYKNHFGLQPDLDGWIRKLRSQYNIADIQIFADFASPGLYGEKKKLMSAEGTVIDTEGESAYRRKDMTDFVMLDAIYQCADRDKNIDTYILFTGDGHFYSVVKYLVEKKRKKVILYGVQDSVSRRMQGAATSCIMLPLGDERVAAYRRMIIENLAYVVGRNDIIPTFLGTAEAVARKHGVNAENVQSVLSDMIEQGYVVRKEYTVEFRRTVKIVAANWEKLIEDGYWDPSEQCVPEMNRIG